MAERRTLTEGLVATPRLDPAVAKELLNPGKLEAAANGEAVEMPKPVASSAKQSSGHSPISRVPISTRIRADFAAALKRASLERQLDGVHPNTLTDLIEAAVEPWLKDNGYLS